MFDCSIVISWVIKASGSFGTVHGSKYILRFSQKSVVVLSAGAGARTVSSPDKGAINAALDHPKLTLTTKTRALFVPSKLSLGLLLP